MTYFLFFWSECFLFLFFNCSGSCCVQAFFSCREQGLLFTAVHGLLTVQLLLWSTGSRVRGLQELQHVGSGQFLGPSSFCSVAKSCSTLRPQGLQHVRLPCHSQSPGVCSNPCPLSQWYPPTIPSSVTPFSSCPQSFPASGYFPMSQFFASGGQRTGALELGFRSWDAQA